MSFFVWFLWVVWYLLSYFLSLFSISLSILLYSFSSLLSLLCLCWYAVGQSWDTQPNRILLVTIHHMLYPITVEVLHQVFSPHGFVEKIVTFQKSAGQNFQVFSSLCLSFLYFLFKSCYLWKEWTWWPLFLWGEYV